jgi:quinol-cytochrome oxidoreductase complex cytochrome b subunit
MSYQEKSVTVSLFSSLLILGYYLTSIFRMYFGGGLVSGQVFRLAGIVIGAAIIVNIAANILTNIILSIIHAIRTGKEEEERFIEDERDNLIGLKGMKFSYFVFSVGVLLAMITFVVGQPPLVMFSLIVLFALVSEIIGDIVQIALYRRGF